MMLFPYFELAASLFILLFAFDIFSRHYENRTAQFFARFALLAFLACIFEYSVRIAFTLELAGFIHRLSGIAWSFVFPIFAHFCLIFAGKEAFLKKRFSLAALYLPASILSFLFLFTSLMTVRMEIFHFGIASQPALLSWLFVLNMVAYISWGMSLLFCHSKSCSQSVVRSQANLIVIGSFFPAVIGVLADEVLPLVMGYRMFPPTCVFDIAAMIFFIYLAMRNYALFAISPALAADIIIETMPDSMLVTDLDGRILLLNEEAHKYFKAPKEEIIGRPMNDLFLDKEKYKKLYEEVVYKNLEVERFSADMIDPLGEKIPSMINANKIRGDLGTTIGIVYIIRDARG